MPPLTRDELRSRRAVRRQVDRHRSNRVLLTVVAPAVLVAAVIAALVLAFYDGGSSGPNLCGVVPVTELFECPTER